MQDNNAQESLDNSKPVVALVATGVIARTRESARQEMMQQAAVGTRIASRRKGLPSDASPSPQAGLKPSLYSPSGGGRDEADSVYLYSPRHADEATVRELQARPPIDIVVLNRGKEDEVVAPTQTSTKKAVPPSMKRQSWFSPVHVPLVHRKLVESPRIFGDVLPTKPQGDRLSSGSLNQTSSSADRVKPESMSARRVTQLQKPARSTSLAVEEKRRRTIDRLFIEKLRANNQELYDKLVRRFRGMGRLDDLASSGVEPSSVVSISSQLRGSIQAHDEHDNLAEIATVEDAVLFFLHEKHKHDILYFKRRSDLNNLDQPHGGGGLSLSIASNAMAKTDTTSRYMPYDLERVAEPRSDGSDFYIMSATALVHHGSDDGVAAGEAIPIAQWVMESKMFALLLAGIPLFQKFLLRKVFVSWVQESRRLIFVDIRKKIGRSLHLGRRSFAPSMISSLQVLRRVESIRAVSLPLKHVAAASLSALQEHHKERLADAETRLIDAKEELLSLMDSMVHTIQLNTDPSTQLDDLYSAEMSTIHAINPKWKSAPIKALRYRKESLARQVDAARHDLDILHKYVRLMEYMFSESVYLMVLGCVQHLTNELRSEDNLGAISAAVAIVGDELVLSPSVVEMKNVLLEGIARLVRLAGNFHFSKNAATWSTNRGSGALSSAFLSDAIATQFDLQDVLRQDPAFQRVSTSLITEVISCFNDAAQQMKAFESLKPIYAAVQSVSRAETMKTLQLSASSSNVRAEAIAVSELPSVIGVSGSELARYLRSLSHRLAVLDKSQHACQKIQSSWKVRFLEIQCRRSVNEILELINREREMLHQHVFHLASSGANDCIVAIQKGSLVFEDRPQLIEYFCEQLKLVKALKDREKQLHQDIRNVDEIVRALKRYAPTLMNESSVQYNLLHTMLGKYATLTQSHDKFVAKVLPSITQQVSSALQRYTVRCQKLLRLYDEHAPISTEEELEKHVGTFQDITKEIKTIEDATKLYQDYQRMVGMKVTEIMSLAEAKTKWEEVESVVAFLIQWKTATKLMESGIFSDQPWRNHLDKVNTFLERVLVMLQDRSRVFASKMLERLRSIIVDYQRRLELVIEMAQPFVKVHHWHQILVLLDIINFVSPSGVVVSDGSTLTLGFLQTRSLWKFEGHVRDIVSKAKNDAVTESKMEEMKKRLHGSLIPLVKVGEVYELETAAAFRLLAQFETDLVTVQMLAQLTASTQLSSNLALWAEEISSYQEILDWWIKVQTDWKRLTLIFGHHDVQQIVVDATYEFQALDRKWRAMMTAAKGASSVAICLTEVMSRAFLNTCTVASDKLWKELGNYLYDKRHFFPRLQFVSDRDLLYIIASSKHPVRLCRLICKCFREIRSLKIERVDTARRQRRASVALPHSSEDTVSTDAVEDDDQHLDEEKAVQIFDIHGIVGHSSLEELTIKPLRVSSSPEIWMKDLNQRIQDAVRDEVCTVMDGPLASLYENHFADLNRSSLQPLLRTATQLDTTAPDPAMIPATAHSWMLRPLHVLILCFNVMLTSELTVLVFADRSGSEWTGFWNGFAAKKEQLTTFIRRRDLTSRERLVASTLLVVLHNKASAIDDLYRDDSGSMASSSASLAHHQDTTAIHYNYANGCSFAWTKMMRFFYEPFDKKCMIHQSVKSYEYGNCFISGLMIPVLTPLCDRVVLAMNVALSVEVGGIVYTRSRSQSCGKRTLLKDLATAVGCEMLQVNCSTALGYTQFHRVLLGAIQAQSYWVTLVGLECHVDMVMLRVVARELGRLRDAIHGGLSDSFSVDGQTVNLASSQIALFVCASLDLRGNQDHQELMLRLSHALMPIACAPPELARVAEVVLLANGLRESASVSRKLAALVQLMMHSPVKCMNTVVGLQPLLDSIRAAAARYRANSFRSEERCLVLSLWEQIGSNVIPEQRLTVIKLVKSLFPCAEDLELNALGLLATKTAPQQPPKQAHDRGSTAKPSSSMDASSTEGFEYDSDEEDERQDLIAFRERVRQWMASRQQLIPTDPYIRKLIDLYQVVSRHVLTVVVGPSGSGKTSAIEILSAVFVHEEAVETTGQRDSPDPVAVDSHVKIIRLFPTAFTFKDIYGHFREDASWFDGFLSRFLKNEAIERLHHQRGPASDHTRGPNSARQFSMNAGTSRRRIEHTPWLVLDGIHDADVMEPLKDITSEHPSSVKHLQLPNGDQYLLDNALLRLFCEVDGLDRWGPGTLSRCGVVYFQTDLVPYTVLIKSWGQRLSQRKPKMAALASLMVKLARSMLPPLLEVCKRHSRPPVELVVPHFVSNFLQVLGWLVDQMSAELPSEEASDGLHDRKFQAKVVVVYSALMSIGLAIRSKGREQFHDAVLTLVPELESYLGHGFFASSGRTIYDLGIRFEKEEMQVQVFEAPLPSLVDGYASWHRNGVRRQSTFRRMSNNHNVHASGLMGLGTSPTLFIPTPQLLGYREWMTTMLLAKLNVMVVGESAIGKTRLMEDVLTELMKPENRFDAKCIQVNRSVSSSDMLSVVESGLPRKMRGLYCPSAGKRGLVVAIENLNLEKHEEQTQSSGAPRRCSELIRQICDTKGSFVKATNEFVEFRDVVLATSFSLSAYGYPRLPTRLTRHFQVIAMADPTRDIFRTLQATFPEQLMSRLQATQYQVSDIARLCRFPIEIFTAMRRKLRPSPQAPHLLMSLNDVLRCLMRLVNVSVKAVETIHDLELYTVFTTYQLFRSRMMDAVELATLQTIGIDTTRKLGFTSTAIDVIKSPFEYLYADYGDNEGCVRITSRAAHALFVAADERFQWYNRVAAKDTTETNQQPTATVHGTAQSMGPSPLALIRKASTQAMVEVLASEDSAETPLLARRASNSLMPATRTMLHHHVVEKSTSASPATIQNMLDVLSFLQSGVRHLLFCGAEPSKRRSATMIACGAQAFHFREVTSQLKFAEYVEHLKVPIMEAGLKAAHTLIYVDCDSLTKDEFQVLLHLMLQCDLPHHLYSSSDKAKILAQEHQLRTFQQAHLRRPSVSSFFDDLTSVTSTGDGIIALHQDPASRKEHDSVQSPHKKSIYRDNLRRYLHVVLSFGQTATMFNLVASYPTLYYHSCVKTFRWFDRESLEAVYTECLGTCPPIQETLTRATVAADARHDLQSLAVAIHENGMRLLQRAADGDKPSPDELGRRFAAARSRFEDFLHAFKVLFVFQKTKMTELLDSLVVGVRLLERDSCEARDQLEKNADGHAQLIEAGRAVAQSSQELKECEAMDRDARRAFLLDEQRCAALQCEVEHEREVIQNELNKTLPEISRATEALAQINKYHITEMKSFVNPPQLVRLVMQAVCVLLGVPPTWTEALRILADIRFLDRLRNFDKDHVDVSLISCVKMYTNHPDFSMENMKRASIASTTLCKWVLALVKYFEVMTMVAPTRKKLSITEQQFQQIDEMVRAERQKLIDLELKLNELRAQHSYNVQREKELQRSFESKTKWKAEVVAFQDVVDKWLAVVRKRVARVRDSLFKLVGDSAIVSATVVYASAIPHPRRVDAVARWRELAATHLQGRPSRTSPPTDSVSMPKDYSFLTGWILSEKTLKEEFKRAILGMQIKEEIPLTINMLLMDQIQRVGGRFPLVVDPFHRASAWLKQRGRVMSLMPSSLLLQAMENEGGGPGVQSTDAAAMDTDPLGQNHNSQAHTRRAVAFNLLHRFNILVVDACDATATAQIEKRITHKTPLLILVDHASECDEGVFNSLLDVAVIARKKGGHTVIFSTAATDKMLQWKPKIWSQLGVVDCTPTTDELDDHILTACLKHHWPTLQSEYETACDEYISDRTKEEQVVGGFLECAQKISEEREAMQQSYASSSDEQLHSSTSGFYDHEISRITRCLEEYLLVKRKRQEAKQLVLGLRERRRLFNGFATRGRAFLFAEDAFFHSQPLCAALRWDAASIAMQIEDCVREQVPVWTARVYDGPDASRIGHSMAAAVVRVTDCFLKRRLLGLPSVSHRAFCFLVAVGVAITEEAMNADSILQFFGAVRLQEVLQQRQPTRQPAKHREIPSQAARTSLIHRVASEYVDAAVSDAISKMSGRPQSPLQTGDQASTVQCAELRGLFKRIDAKVLTVMPQSRVEAQRQSLATDMNRTPEVWRLFMQDPLLAFSASDEEEVGEDEALGVDDDEDTKETVPLWIKQQSILSRFLLCLGVFGASSIEMADAVIARYIQTEASPLDVRRSLLATERELGTHPLHNTANSSNRPLLVHYNPRLQASTPFSAILQSARLVGVRDESIMYLSPDTDTHKLRMLKELSISGGWVVLQDVTSARQASKNILRLQLQSLETENSHSSMATAAPQSKPRPSRTPLASRPEFRLWILEALSRTRDSQLTPARLGSLYTQFYLESPDGLRQQYQVYLLEQHVRKQQIERQQQQLLQLQAQGVSATPGSSPTRTSSQSSQAKRASAASLQSPSPQTLHPDQQWIQSALWIFHSIFRTQASLGASTNTLHVAALQRKKPLPLDLVASHYELDRALRIIQLHQRQRTLASTMTAISGLGAATSLSGSTAASEWLSVYQLANLVYANRACYPSLQPLCLNLLATCLVAPNGSGWARSSAFHERVFTTRELVTQLCNDSSGPAPPRSDIDESTLVPLSVRGLKRESECHAALAPVCTAPREPGSMEELLVLSQATAHRLMATMPAKDCLTLGVQQQEHERRRSVITAWKKSRPADVQQGRSLLWQRAARDHLQQIELPALESYVRHIWGLLEHTIALKSDAFSFITTSSRTHDDLLGMLESLRKNDVPHAWSFGPSSSSLVTATYSLPRTLKQWKKWLHKAVELYRRIVDGRPVPETLWLPALGYAKAYLLCLRHCIAVEHDLAPDSLCFEVVTPASPQTESHGDDSSVLATFQVSGLALWNATWSHDMQALQESVTPSSQRLRSSTSHGVALDPLPALTVRVTSRFNSKAVYPSWQLADDLAHPFLYRCPVFLTVTSLSQLDEPVGFFFTPSIDRACVLAACNAAMVIDAS